MQVGEIVVKFCGFTPSQPICKQSGEDTFPVHFTCETVANTMTLRFNCRATVCRNQFSRKAPMMRRIFTICLMSFAVTLSLCGAGRTAVAADDYAYDLVHSSVSFKARHLDVSWIHGRFNEVEGKFSLDHQDPANQRSSSRSSRQRRYRECRAADEHLRQPDYFDTKQFPTIEFKSTSVKAIDGYEVTGDFTMHRKRPKK